MTGCASWRRTANESGGRRALRRAPAPPWLCPADLEVSARRFAPLDSAEVRRSPLDLAQGSTPVELLLLRLVAAGLSPTAARQLIADLRGLREPPGLHATLLATAAGN